MTREGLIALLVVAEEQDRLASFVIANAARDRVMVVLPDIIAALRDDGWRPIESAPARGGEGG